VTRIRTLTLALAALLLAAPLLAQEHDHSHHGVPEQLGTVHFPVACRAELQADFDRAVALLHSFGYEEARRAFTAVSERDPGCAMAQWGVAMTLYHPLWAPPTAAELAAGAAAAEKAAALGATEDRERAYVAAIGAFYRDSPATDHRTRAAAYRAAMADLVRRFPDDDEGQIFHALALLGTAPPSDSTYAQQKQAAAILGKLLPEHPEHPGIAHYVIHSFDYPELAELALPAARSYARIAPDSPHALHMPSHIFTRLGLWKESIDSNLDSAAAGEIQAAERHPGAASFDALHAYDYLEYAYLQICREEKARALVERTRGAARFDEGNFAAGYALAAIPARFALERRAWREAAALAPPAAPLPWERFPYALALHHFARSLGAARSGDPALLVAARQALAELERAATGLRQAPAAGPYDWTGQVEALRLAAAGWLAQAEGRSAEAVKLLAEAADLEERVGKHPVTPGAVLPARELYADLLLELRRPAEALDHYRRTLAAAPRRFNALAGAARAAEAAGRTADAKSYYLQLLELCGPEGSREELRRAREATASR
jgi:tetratricopeptide (TPR) repeat protein